MSKTKHKAKKVTVEDLPELEQYRLGQRIVAVVVGLGLTGVAITKTILYALQGNSGKAVSNAKKAVEAFVKTIEPDAKSDKKKGKEAEVSLGRKLFRIFGGLAVLGLGVATTVFKAIRGDITGAAGDLGDIVTLGMEVAYGIMPFFGSKVKNETPGIFSKLVAPITSLINNTIDLAKSIADKAKNRMEESPTGRVMLKLGKAAKDITTSQHVKVLVQLAAAIMAIITATTPIGWAIAALSLGAIVGTGIKALLHARSLRLLNEKKECLISLHKEREEQSLLLRQNPTLQQLQQKTQASDSQGALGENPQRPPINVGREILSAFASRVVGGAAAILEATTAEPAAQAAVAFVLLEGIAKEAKGNIKKEISLLDLKEEIWKLGGSDKDLSQVQAELLESKRQNFALALLAADIERTKSTENIQERFEHFMQKATEVHKTPTPGDRIKGGFRGFVRDCDTLFFGSIREGWRELTGKKDAKSKPSNIPEVRDVIPAPVKYPTREETKVTERTSRQNNVKMKVMALEAAQEVAKHIPKAHKHNTARTSGHDVHISAQDAIKEARGHVVQDTHAGASRNQQQGKIGTRKHRAV